MSNSSATPVYLNEDSNTIVGDPASFASTFASGRTTIDGVPCTTLPTVTHYHVHVSIFSNGRQVAVPNGIGIYHPAVVFPKYFVDSNPNDPSACVYDVHVHAAMGVVHLESNTSNVVFSLGQFLNVWGVQLSATGFWQYSGITRVFDTDESGTAGPGKQPVTELTGQDPEKVYLQSHHEYTIEVGAPYVGTPNYTWSSSL